MNFLNTMHSSSVSQFCILNLKNIRANILNKTILKTQINRIDGKYIYFVGQFPFIFQSLVLIVYVCLCLWVWMRPYLMMFSLDLGDKQSIQKLLYWIALFSQCKLLFLQTKTVNSNTIIFLFTHHAELKHATT